jgi:hypothetical protein
MKRTYSLIATALLVSLFIYLFYRTEKTVVNELMALLFSWETFAEARSAVAKAIPLSGPIIFSLPGGLWVFCTTTLSRDLYLKIANQSVRMTAAPILFAIGLECCQLLRLTKGTFDLWDIVSYLMFWLAAHYGSRSSDTPQNIMAPFTFNSFICLVCFLSVYLAHVSQ